MLLDNLGDAPLHITGLTASRDDLTASVEPWEDPPEGVLEVVGPRAGTIVTVVPARGAPAGPIEGTIEVSSNDPDEPVLRIPVVGGKPALAEGNTGPDFSLPDLDGRVHSLSDYRDKVVHLMLFNSMCESCGEALPWLGKDVWGPLAGQDFQPLIIHVGPDTHLGLKILEEAVEEDGGEAAPMLLDIDASVEAAWTQVHHTGVRFPLNYVIDKAGLVHKVSVKEAVEEPWTAWIEEIL